MRYTGVKVFLTSGRRVIETNTCSMTGPNELMAGLCACCFVFNNSFEDIAMVNGHRP